MIEEIGLGRKGEMVQDGFVGTGRDLGQAQEPVRYNGE